MKLEKVVQLENGSEVKILVSIWVDSVKNEFAYNHAITLKPKGKKEFSIALPPYSVEVNKAIDVAKTELWKKLKP
jgi:hypothetical protein